MDDPLLRHIFDLLRAKDDTSKFVGLSLLHSWIDQDVSRLHVSAVVQCWKAIPTSFLLRLLKAQTSVKISDDDARNMSHLAIAIIHTFITLLPPEEIDACGFVIYCQPLIISISSVDAPQKTLVIQSLQSMASTRFGRGNLLASPDPFALILKSTAADDQLVPEVVTIARLLGMASAMNEKESLVFRDIVAYLLETLEERVDLVFQALTDIVNSRELNENDNWMWLGKPLVTMKQQFVQQPRKKLREACVLFAGSLLRRGLHPDFPSLIYGQSAKDFSLLFVKLLMVDVRSTIPTLISILSESSYQSISFRLALSYDLLTSFLSVLLRLSDNDQSDITLSIAPDQLLKLRSDLTETFSLTLEYFRDRWDAAVAGAAGLHESARAPQPSTSTSTPLPLTWDSPALPVAKDPMILSGLRCVAIWLQEDENETLRSEALGILDMLLGLFKFESEDPEAVDFRQPVLTIIHAIIPFSDAGVDDLLNQGGWEIIAEDLMRGFKQSRLPDHMHDAIRVLLDLVDSNTVYQSREEWMKVIAVAAEKQLDLTKLMDQEMEDVIAAYQLALAIYQKAPKRLQKTCSTEMQSIRRNAVLFVNKAERVLAPESEMVQDAQDLMAGLSSLTLC
jgi:Neurochondrin